MVSEKDSSPAHPAKPGEGKVPTSNLLLGRPIKPDSLWQVEDDNAVSTRLKSIAGHVLLGNAIVCGLLLTAFGIYALCAGETALVTKLVWPVATCSGAVVLWAARTAGPGVLRELRRGIENMNGDP